MDFTKSFHGQKVRFVAQKPVFQSVYYTDHTPVVNTAGRFVWLQKLALRLLWKYGRAYSRPEFSNFEAVTVDTAKVLDGLRKQQYLLEAIYQRHAERLFIGPDAYHQLMGETWNIQRPIEIPLSYQMWTREGGTRFMHLIVTIVPWMEGILVMPADDFTKLHDSLDDMALRLNRAKSVCKQLRSALVLCDYRGSLLEEDE